MCAVFTPSLPRPCVSPQEERRKPARAPKWRNEKIGVLVQVTAGGDPQTSRRSSAMRCGPRLALGSSTLVDCHPAAASILDRGCIRSLTSFGSLPNCGRARSRQQCNQAQFVARSTKAKGAPHLDERKSTFPRRANPRRPPWSVSTIHNRSHRHFSLFKVSLWAHSEPQ
jgi:hypothetical protein